MWYCSAYSISADFALETQGKKTHFSPRGQREVGRRKVHLVVTKSGNTMAKIVRKI
jgi:hypothetical protein